MNALPLEVLVKILSILDLEEQVNCRLISRKFKDAAYHSVRLTEYLAMTGVNCEHYLLCKKYLSVKFVKCNFGISLALAQKFSRLQVLYAPYNHIKLKELEPFGRSLKFFYCQCLVIEMKNEQIILTMKSFLQLEAFHCQTINRNEKEAHDLISSIITDKLVREKKQIPYLMDPSAKNFKQITESKGYSIDAIQFKLGPDSNLFIPAEIGPNLHSLQIQTNYMQHVDSIETAEPLSNLEYLYLSLPFFSDILSEKFFLSKRLKVIRCSCVLVSRHFMQKFLSDLNTYEQLEHCVFRKLHIMISAVANDTLTTYEVSLPPKIKTFISLISQPYFEITNESCDNLRRLECLNFSKFDGHFSRLQLLKIGTLRLLNEEEGKKLCFSLSSCIELKSLDLDLGNNLLIKSVINSIEKLEKLENLHLENYYDIQTPVNSDDNDSFKVSFPPNIKTFEYNGKQIHLDIINDELQQLETIKGDYLTLEGRLPSLRELRITILESLEEEVGERMLRSIISCSKLRHLELVPLTDPVIMSIVKSLGKFSDLQMLTIRDVKYGSGYCNRKINEHIKVSFPPNIQMLEYNGKHVHFELTNDSLEELQIIHGDNMSIEGKFPSCEELSLTIDQPFDEVAGTKFLGTISSCVKLASLKLTFSKKLDISFIQSLVDSFQTLPKLGNISLKSRYYEDDYYENDDGKFVYIDLTKFKSQEIYLRWLIQARVEINITEPYERFDDFSGALHLKVRKCKSYYFYPGTLVTFVPTQELAIDSQ